MVLLSGIKNLENKCLFEETISYFISAFYFVVGDCVFSICRIPSTISRTLHGCVLC